MTQVITIDDSLEALGIAEFVDEATEQRLRHSFRDAVRRALAGLVDGDRLVFEAGALPQYDNSDEIQGAVAAAWQDWLDHDALAILADA